MKPFIQTLSAAAALFLAFSQQLEAQALSAARGICLSSNTMVTASHTRADTALAQKKIVRALAIYVAFPDQPSPKLPAVAARLETELPKFIRSMSEGRQTLVVETALRPAPFAAFCYVADSAMSYYQKRITEPPPKATGMEVLTDEILDKVETDMPNFAERYDVIFFNLLGNFFSGADGFSLLVRGDVWEKRYTGLGVTNELTDPEVFLGIVGHEYGHLLGAQHPPNFLEKSFGDYELMDQNLHRLAPYSIQNLMDIGWLAPERVQVVNDTLYNVALDDVRRGGKVLLIEADLNQYFLVANHQGSDYDSVYVGRGLLIWHQAGNTLKRTAQSIWDVESAAGMFREGAPDPWRGIDALDSSRAFTGDARDFFEPVRTGRFAFDTNPNTNLYDRNNTQFDWRSQTQPSGVAIENLRQVGNTIFADVLVPNRPPQITAVSGPVGFVDSFESYSVTATIQDDHTQATAELYYRYGGEQSFRVVPMHQSATLLFSAPIPSPRLAKSVEYYVRAIDRKSLEAFYPEAAPTQTLRFFIKITLDDVLPLDSVQVSVRGGELLQVPIALNNSSDGELLMSNSIIVHESLHDERALAADSVETNVYVPYVFFDLALSRDPSSTYERAPTIYLRNKAGATARLHFTYTETTLYLYFVRLQPRAPFFSLLLNLYWRDPSGRVQEVWLTIDTSGQLQMNALPGVFNLNATYSAGSSGALPRILMTIPMSALRSSPQIKDWDFRADMLDEPNTRGYWPGVAESTKPGALLLQESTPHIFFDDASWVIPPQAVASRYLYIALPARPWSAEMQGGLLVRVPELARTSKYIPFKIKVINFRPWSEPDTTRDTDPDSSDNTGNVPQSFQMRNVYPNPFVLSSERSPALHLAFDLPKAATVRVELFDLLGKRVANLAQQWFEAGRREMQWRGLNLQKGIYFIRMQAGSHRAVKKLIAIE